MESLGFESLTNLGPKATVTQRGILKSLVYHVLNFKSWIKLIYDKITCTYCVINEFNPTFEMQNMPRLETPRLETGTRITVAYGLELFSQT